MSFETSDFERDTPIEDGAEDAEFVRDDLVEAERLRSIGADPGSVYLDSQRQVRRLLRLVSADYIAELDNVIKPADILGETEQEPPPTAA